MSGGDKGWIGVDLDGTLAEYHGWVGPDHIGDPIPAMVERVKAWHRAGKEVRIFTARVATGPGGHPTMEALKAELAIERWMEKNLGFSLPVTCMKDYGLVEMWDDRAVQVEQNTGRRIDGQPD